MGWGFARGDQRLLVHVRKQEQERERDIAGTAGRAAATFWSRNGPRLGPRLLLSSERRHFRKEALALAQARRHSIADHRGACYLLRMCGNIAASRA